MTATDALTGKMASRFATASGVADAVLYEGYVLYPYHATNGKNHGGVRFQWGVLVPPSWLANDSCERTTMRTELIVDPGQEPQLAVRLRFLQLQHRALEESDESADGGFRRTEKLQVGDRVWMEWDEAIEREIDLAVISLLPIEDASVTIPLVFPATSETEIVTEDEADPQSEVRGRIVRSTEDVSGEARVTISWADGPGVLVKVSIEVENTTQWTVSGSREDVMRRALIAVHTLGALEDGAFCSVFDPPEHAVEAVAGCHSVASYAVLVGAPGATDLVLASPIILYDYPAIAPESDGDFHDGCEIDEILALRVLTLTEEEKAEARGTDPRARAIIDRCDNMEESSWGKLHGTMRDIRSIEAEAAGIGFEADEPEPVPWLDPVIDASFDPWTDTVVIAGAEIGKGSRVRLVPSHRADAHDIFLSGMTATVAGIFHDVDGGFHVAVTIDGDPATEIYEFQGRFYYFHPDEVEPLSEEEANALGQAEAIASGGRVVDDSRRLQRGEEEYDFPTIVGDGSMGKKGGDPAITLGGAGEAAT
jgi:hypothetical protein